MYNTNTYSNQYSLLLTIHCYLNFRIVNTPINARWIPWQNPKLTYSKILPLTNN